MRGPEGLETCESFRSPADWPATTRRASVIQPRGRNDPCWPGADICPNFVKQEMGWPCWTWMADDHGLPTTRD